VQRIDPLGLAALAFVLASGIGGALGAVALDAPDLAVSLLAFAGGLMAGLASPQVGSRPPAGQ